MEQESKEAYDDEELNRRKRLSQAFTIGVKGQIIPVPYSPRYLPLLFSNESVDIGPLRYITDIQTYHEIIEEVKLVFMNHAPFRGSSPEILAQIPERYFSEHDILYYVLTNERKREKINGTEYFVGRVYLYRCEDESMGKMFEPEYQGGNEVEIFKKFQNLEKKKESWLSYFRSFFV